MGGRGLSTGFVSAQILCLPGTPRGDFVWSPTLRPPETWAREKLVLREWAGPQVATVTPSFCLDDSHLLAGLPAASPLSNNPFSPQGLE